MGHLLSGLSREGQQRAGSLRRQDRWLGFVVILVALVLALLLAVLGGPSSVGNGRYVPLLP
jgi:hypothetical protein